MNLKWGQNLMLKGIHSNVLHEIKKTGNKVNSQRKKMTRQIMVDLSIKSYAMKRTFYKEFLIKIPTTIATANPYMGQTLS